jgi:hypothetical protein
MGVGVSWWRVRESQNLEVLFPYFAGLVIERFEAE